MAAARSSHVPPGPAADADAKFLVVRSGGERLGLGLRAVREVVDLAPPRAVPARSPALRGVMPLRERWLSLVHLGALLGGGAPPPALGDTAVVVTVGRAVVALEVDGVEEVVDRGATFVGAAPTAWAAGVWRLSSGLVTVLDLGALAELLNLTAAADAAASEEQA